MSQYTSKTLVENYSLIEIADAFDSQIEDWIEAMSAFIENETNRAFTSTQEERKFDGNNRTRLMVGDLTELTAVELDGTDITSDVLTYPANETPKNVIYYEYGFTRDKQNVVVDAKWGYSDTAPKAIEHIATVLVAGIIQNQEKTEEAIKSEKIGNYQVSYSEEQFPDFQLVERTLSAFKKYAL